MADAIAWISANWQVVVGTAGTVVMSAAIAVKAIAPFTKTDKDDRAAGWLSKVHVFLSKLALNPPLKEEEK